MALTVTGPITITYSGGAAGPASTTAAALAAGFAIPTLPVGGGAVFSAPVNITGTTVQSNTATIAAPPGTNDPTPANNTSTAVTNPVALPVADVEAQVKRAETTAGGPVQAGIGQMRMLFRNNGPADAAGAVLKDLVTSQVGVWNYTGAPGTITYFGGATGPATCTPAQLLAGVTVTAWPLGDIIEIIMPTNFEPAGAGGTNTARVDAVGFTDPVPGNNAATATFDVPPLPPPCQCGADILITTFNAGGGFTLGNYNSPSLAPNCCDEVRVFAEIYPTLADATNDTNILAILDSGPLACGAGGWGIGWAAFQNAGNYIKFLVRVTTLVPSICEVAEGGGIITPPYGARISVRTAGTWPIRPI